MAAERLDGAIGVDMQKRILVITARPRGLIVQAPVEIAVPIASVKAVMSHIMLAEAQAENGNAVMVGDSAASQNGVATNIPASPVKLHRT